jgi:ATP-dependent Lon protease
MAIVSQYTRESGVRQLERQVGAVARKVARRLASGAAVDLTIAPDDVRELLGRPRVHPERAGQANEVGVATGMYYTPAGGDIMFVEAALRRLYGLAPATRRSRSAAGATSR